MKCSNPKCKGKRRLMTVRTFDDRDKTRREKRCPACSAQVFTVELREKDHHARIDELQNQIADADNRTRTAEFNLEDIKDTVRHLLDAVMVKKEKKYKPVDLARIRRSR